jgi:hypothetical protein
MPWMASLLRQTTGTIHPEIAYKKYWKPIPGDPNRFEYKKAVSESGL